MRLILDDCFVSDETEPGLLSGVGRPSCLHLTNPTSRFSQLWKTSGQVAERRNSFLCCEVSTDKVSSLFRPPGLLRRYQGLMWRGSQHLGPSDESQWSASEASASLKERLWKILQGRHRTWEGSWWWSAAPLVPFPGQLWNTPCLECIQNVVLQIRNKWDTVFDWYKNPLFQDPVNPVLALSLPPCLSLPLTQLWSPLSVQPSVLGPSSSLKPVTGPSSSLVAWCPCSSAFRFNKGK